MFIYKLTQMLETCWYESLQGRAGYIIYTYCMYTIKLKALILSIVFNYLRFLMMKIDCTVFFFLFFACACCCQNRQKLYGWYTPTLMSNSCSARCKKKKKGISAVVCCPSWMHRLNICNSGFAIICIWVFTKMLKVLLWLNVWCKEIEKADYRALFFFKLLETNQTN